MQKDYIEKAACRKAAQHAENEYRNALLAKAKADGVGIVHIFNEYSAKGGLTVAYQKANEYDSGVMVTVAINVCSKEDSFSRSIGTRGALDKFFDGQTVQLPILNNWEPEDISLAIKFAFSQFYFAM